MLLDWEKKKKNKKELAVFVLEDWLGKSLHDIKQHGNKSDCRAAKPVMAEGSWRWNDIWSAGLLESRGR